MENFQTLLATVIVLLNTDFVWVTCTLRCCAFKQRKKSTVSQGKPQHFPEILIPSCAEEFDQQCYPFDTTSRARDKKLSWRRIYSWPTGMTVLSNAPLQHNAFFSTLTLQEKYKIKRFFFNLGEKHLHNWHVASHRSLQRAMAVRGRRNVAWRKQESDVLQ